MNVCINSHMNVQKNFHVEVHMNVYVNHQMNFDIYIHKNIQKKILSSAYKGSYRC